MSEELLTEVKDGVMVITINRPDAKNAMNKAAAEAALKIGVNACTDVTGFGLLGHLHHLAAASGCSARIGAASVPVFDFTHDLARQVVPVIQCRFLGHVGPLPYAIPSGS